MEEILKLMQERKRTAYNAYREAELTEDNLSYSFGILDGMDMMIDLVKEFMNNDNNG